MQPYGVNGKAIASMCISIFSVLCCCVWYVAFIAGVVSVVLGILAIRDENPRQKDMGIAGVVVGSVGTVLALATVILSMVINSHLS